jgi:hypothetical protein
MIDDWLWNRRVPTQLATLVLERVRSPDLKPLPYPPLDYRRRGDIEGLVRDLYLSLRGVGIDYALAPWDKGIPDPYNLFQRIRPPWEILVKGGQGTCLDLTLLFCGLCLDHGLVPLVVIVEGHAFAAVSTRYTREDYEKLPTMPRSRPVREDQEVFGSTADTARYPDYDWLLKQLKPPDQGLGPPPYLAVECTGFARWLDAGGEDTYPERWDREADGTMNYDHARRAGEAHLNPRELRKVKLVLNVSHARLYGTFGLEYHTPSRSVGPPEERGVPDRLRVQIDRWDHFGQVKAALGEFKLQWMSSVRHATGLPIQGTGLIVVANVQGVLHFRIFDAHGEQVVDTDETQLPGKASQIQELKSQLGDLGGVTPLSRGDKDRVIKAVKSIIYQTIQRDMRPLVMVVHGDREQEHRDFATRVALRMIGDRPTSRYLCDVPLPHSTDPDNDEDIRPAVAQDWNLDADAEWPKILPAMAADPRPLVFTLGFGADRMLRFEAIGRVLDYWNNWAAGPGSGAEFRPVILLCVEYDPVEYRKDLLARFERLRKRTRIRVRLERMPIQGYLGRLNVDRLGPLPNVWWTDVEQWAKRKTVKDHFGPAHERFLREVTNSLSGDFQRARWGLPMTAVVNKLARIKVEVS